MGTPEPEKTFIEKVQEEREAVGLPEIKPPEIVPATTLSIRERLNVVPPGSDGIWSMLIHADSGVGKTHFIGTAGEIGPVILFDCEGGTDSIRHMKNVDVKRVYQMEDLTKYHEELTKYNQGWYKFGGLDSLSEIQDVDMRTVMKQAKAASKDPDNFNMDVPSPREWGIGRNHVRIVARGFRDLGMNLIVTTLTNVIQKEGKADRYVPNLPGKLGYEIPGFMGIVGWYHFDDSAQTRRVMQLKGTNRVMAKTRFRELGDLLENPTVPMIMELLEKNKEEQTNE